MLVVRPRRRHVRRHRRDGRARAAAAPPTSAARRRAPPSPSCAPSARTPPCCRRGRTGSPPTSNWESPHEAARLRRGRLHRLQLRPPARRSSTATPSPCSTSSPTPAARRTSPTCATATASPSCTRASRTPTPSRTAMDGVDAVVNFAAETHVDRSIAEPDAFITTHALGTFVLLEAARARGVRYVQVSTDEVYGSIEAGSFTEAVAAAAVLALLGHQGRRRPARRLLPPHLRARGADLPRLEQLRALPVPGEADPADGAQRAARRPAAGLRRRPAGAQLDLRGGLRARHRPRAGPRRRPARPTTSAGPTRPSTSTSCSASSRSRAPPRT